MDTDMTNARHSRISDRVDWILVACAAALVMLLLPGCVTEPGIVCC